MVEKEFNVGNHINTNKSVLGKDLVEWICDVSLQRTDEEIEIARLLYTKYIVDRFGKPKKKIYPDVYYYVNYNDRVNPGLFLAYIVRDKFKSPRKVNSNLANLDLTEVKESFKGSLIREWSFYQNGSATHPYYIEGNEIITKYFNGSHAPRHNVYYFVVKTSKGVQLIRDLKKSPTYGWCSNADL